MLIDEMLRATFGGRAPSGFLFGLFDGATETKVPGYERVTVPVADWSVGNGSVSTVVRFGPFVGTATFDRVRLFRVGDPRVVEELVMGHTTIPRDAVYEYEPVFMFAKMGA